MFQWTSFGKIKYNEEVYECDIYIDTSGEAHLRDYSISKKLYGTGHKVGQEELGEIVSPDTTLFILGTGQQGIAELTDDAKRVLKEAKIKFEAMPTPEAIKFYNKKMVQKGKKPRVTALMHVTC